MKPNLRLYKKEKLCSEVAISQLFNRDSEGVKSSLAYPLRVAWKLNPGRRGDDVAQFLVSVPKKRLRHAVDRVTVRRRVREAYRLNRHLLPKGAKIDMAFIYVASEVLPSSRIVPALCRLLSRISTPQK
ncbi:MAG: ribonuclease P protein component [Muribaculaceae bacterium]|nr:ribonuclease P protein component [Muribaculaceae bacterium]